MTSKTRRSEHEHASQDQDGQPNAAASEQQSVQRYPAVKLNCGTHVTPARPVALNGCGGDGVHRRARAGHCCGLEDLWEASRWRRRDGNIGARGDIPGAEELPGLTHLRGHPVSMSLSLDQRVCSRRHALPDGSQPLSLRPPARGLTVAETCPRLFLLGSRRKMDPDTLEASDGLRLR